MHAGLLLAGWAVCVLLAALGVPAAGVLPWFFLAISALLTFDSGLGAVAAVGTVGLCLLVLVLLPPTVTTPQHTVIRRPVAPVTLLSVAAWFTCTNALVWGLVFRLRRQVHAATRAAENVLPLAHDPGPGHLYARLVDLAPDAVAVVDSAGRIVFWNQMARSLFGYTREEILGQEVDLLLPEDLRAAHREHRAAFLRQPRTRPMGLGLELEARRKDGSTFPVEIALGVIERPDTDTPTLLVKASVRDITPRKAQEQALIEARVKQRIAEDAVRERDQWLATAAHELKTPITSISGFAELLERTLAEAPVPLPNGQRHRVQHALAFLASQTARLARLIDQLLDLSRLQQGRLELACEEVDLVALCAEYVIITQSSTHDHRIVLAAPQAPLMAQVDPLRLGQVLSNLLSNAAKYAPDGPITLRVERQGEKAFLSVRDHGPGVPPARRPFLFSRFAQVHEPNGQDRGLGLGLFLARELVYLHHGEIWAEFPPDGGMQVCLTLPLRAPRC